MRIGERLLGGLDRLGWVSWERSSPGARLLMVTNAWPTQQRPQHGIFLRGTVDGLARHGIESDVLFVHGYRGPHCYLAACLVAVLLPVLRRGKYRLVNSHGGEVALAARCFWGAPVIASYWGSDILGPRAGGRRRAIKLLIQSRILRLHAQLMTATTTKSAEMEGCLPARARRRNWVIPDGVDRSRFAPGDRAAARERLGWEPEGLVVISVGRPIALKRTWLAEQAVAAAARTVSGLSWRLICDVMPEQMPLVYNAADCLIHTSVSEGSPNVVKEALASDLPVVATASGDIPQLLAGVEPSAVCRADAEQLAEALIACVLSHRRSNGRERSAALGLEPIAARTLACYRAVAPDLFEASPISRS
jgi:glycosyltransferase involved in cell wall biosynthesis